MMDRAKGDAIPDGRGYVLDEPYTARYFDLQSPARIGYSIACAGFEHPLPSGSFRYAELGCGNGVTLATLAALHPQASFLGVDINPAHVAWATDLAGAAGLSNVVFLQADFGRAIAMPWAAFDYITAHGVYAWVDATVREQLFSFIARHLAAQGVACVSYNAYPGWSAKEPLWRLVERHTRALPGGSLERIGSGLRYLDALREAGIPYFAGNPQASALLDYLKAEDPRYVAHEFCNRHFAPRYCEEVFADAARHGLRFVAQAETQPNLPFARVPSGCGHLVDEIDDFDEREILASLLRNESFRTDLYMRERPTAVDIEASPLWDRVFTSVVPIRHLGREIEGGGRTLDSSDPLVEALITHAEAGRWRLRELCQLPALRRFSPRTLLETAQVLELSTCFAFLPAAGVSGGVGTTGDGEAAGWRFGCAATRELLERGLRDNGFGSLLAPRLGSALRIGALESLAILVLTDGDPASAGERFAACLNEQWPELLSFRIDAVWAAGYLADIEADWGSLLRKLGTLVSA